MFQKYNSSYGGNYINIYDCISTESQLLNDQLNCWIVFFLHLIKFFDWNGFESEFVILNCDPHLFVALIGNWILLPWLSPVNLNLAPSSSSILWTDQNPHQHQVLSVRGFWNYNHGICLSDQKLDFVPLPTSISSSYS